MYSSCEGDISSLVTGGTRPQCLCDLTGSAGFAVWLDGGVSVPKLWEQLNSFADLTTRHSVLQSIQASECLEVTILVQSTPTQWYRELAKITNGILGEITNILYLILGQTQEGSMYKKTRRKKQKKILQLRSSIKRYLFFFRKLVKFGVF